MNRQETLYLGFIITGIGMKTYPEKITSVLEWPIPKNKTELMSFVGLCSYYRKFFENFYDNCKTFASINRRKSSFHLESTS